MELTFDQAKPEEAQILCDLINRAYRGESSKVGWTTEADLLGGQRTDKAAIEDLIKSKNKVILNTYTNKKLIGCVLLEKKTETLAYLGMLTVEPGLQDKGIGRKILENSEHFVVKNWNCIELEMTVIPIRTELIDWYKRRGYLVTGEKRPFPATDPRFGIPKRNDLNFVVLSKTLGKKA